MKKIKAILVLWFLCVFVAQSNIQIEIDENLDISKYPEISIRIRAYKNGQIQKLSSEQIIILDGNLPFKPEKVSEPSFDGFQLVQWRAKGWGSSLAPNSTNSVYALINLYVTIGEETAHFQKAIETKHPLYDNPVAEIKPLDNDRNILREIRFGNVHVGDYTNKRINLVSVNEKTRGNTKFQTRIDWVGTTSNDFKYLWLGSNTNTDPPPVFIVSPFLYAIEVLFIPQENKYYREYLIVSYENGKELPISLVGNSFPIAKKNQMNLLQPKKDDILFTCQSYYIRWKGNKPNTPVSIYYSTNRGSDWIPIDKVLGNEYLWVVPNFPSDSVQIKISQEYSHTPESSLKTDANKPQKIAFNSDGTKLLSASMDGKISEFDFLSKTQLKTYSFSNLNFPLEKANITNLAYCNNDSNVVISYRTMDFYDVEGNDTILVVNLSDGSILGKIALPKGERIGQFSVDHKRNYLILFKSPSNVIEIYQLPQLSFVQNLTFTAPIQNITLKNNLLAVALLSNTIVLYDLTTLTQIKQIELKYLPYITNIALSNDSKLLAFTTKKFTIPDIYQNLSDAYVLDINSGVIVRSLYKNWSDAITVDFSPTDNFVVLGFQNQPSIILWDIVNDIKTDEINGAGYSISDCKLSPTGFVVATTEPERNVIVTREFDFQEIVVSEPFKIHRAKITTKEAKFQPQKIYSPITIPIDDHFCNIGDVPLIIDYCYFTKGRNFSLSRNPTGDTLYPQSCGNFSIIYNPKDTGTFYDTLVVIACYQEYRIPLMGKGINRDFSFTMAQIDFGEVCVNQSREFEFEIGINNDTLELPIDFIRIDPSSNRYFSIISSHDNQILGKSEKLKVIIKFQPREIGSFSSYLEIFYLGQKDYIFRIPIVGKGIGIELSVAPSDIRFIPEIPQQSFLIKNNSETDVVVDSVVFSPANSYSLDIQTPFVIASKSAKMLNITMQNSSPIEAQMTIYSSPCGVNQIITLGPYIGSSEIYFQEIKTIPKGEIEIPILFKNIENKPYNGRRFFEAEVSFNPRMFLPFDVKSEWGETQVLRNEIINDRRVLTFRIQGNFPLEGTIGKIIGNVGLGESDTSAIDWNPQSAFWGKNVQVSAKPGLIQLTGLCGTRRILLPADSLNLIQINPQPASTSMDLILYSNYDDLMKIQIVDIVGNVIQTSQVLLNEGTNKISLYVGNLSPGVYRIILQSKNILINKSFLKI